MKELKESKQNLKMSLVTDGPLDKFITQKQIPHLAKTNLSYFSNKLTPENLGKYMKRDSIDFKNQNDLIRTKK